MITDICGTPYDGCSQETASSPPLISSAAHPAILTKYLDHLVPVGEAMNASEGSWRRPTVCKRLVLKTFNKLLSLNPDCLDVES